MEIPKIIPSNPISEDSFWYLRGPKNRRSEFLFTLKVLVGFIKGFRKLHFIGPCITVFGSARFNEGHEYYAKARQVGSAIANLGFTTLTGGGPGIMEAANRGAYESGGKSVGCNIKLPKEQRHNDYMHSWVTLEYFFVRKVLLLKYSYAFIVMPGGMGTMDELFETLTLIQTGIIQNFPIVLIGNAFFKKLQIYLDHMVSEGTISRSDLDLVKVTDSINEAMAHISKYIQTNYELYEKQRPIWWLFERPG